MYYVVMYKGEHNSFWKVWSHHETREEAEAEKELCGRDAVHRLIKSKFSVGMANREDFDNV